MPMKACQNEYFWGIWFADFAVEKFESYKSVRNHIMGTTSATSRNQSGVAPGVAPGFITEVARRLCVRCSNAYTNNENLLGDANLARHMQQIHRKMIKTHFGSYQEVWPKVFNKATKVKADVSI